MNHITKLLEKVKVESFKHIQTRNHPANIGMDTRKDTSVVSMAIPARTQSKYLGTINTQKNTQRTGIFFVTKYV